MRSAFNSIIMPHVFLMLLMVVVVSFFSGCSSGDDKSTAAQSTPIENENGSNNSNRSALPATSSTATERPDIYGLHDAINFNESCATFYLREINTAQETFALLHNNTYAQSLEELLSGEKPFLRGDWKSPKNGYTFALEGNGLNVLAKATPTESARQIGCRTILYRLNSQFAYEDTDITKGAPMLNIPWMHKWNGGPPDPSFDASAEIRSISREKLVQTKWKHFDRDETLEFHADGTLIVTDAKGQYPGTWTLDNYDMVVKYNSVPQYESIYTLKASEGELAFTERYDGEFPYFSPY